MRFRLNRQSKRLYVVDPIVITCVFGVDFNALHKAPSGFTAVCFSNNPLLKIEAINKGWNFRLIQSLIMVLTKDERISSIQSKYIKFLKFLDDFPDLNTGGPILYVDHKVEMDAHHVCLLQEMIAKDKAILIRNTPRFKSTIYDEVEDALPFPRYAKSMPQTLEWVRK